MSPTRGASSNHCLGAGATRIGEQLADRGLALVEQAERLGQV